MGDGAGRNIERTSPNTCKGNAFSSFLLHCSESASPSCSDSSPCPGMLALLSTHGLDTSCLNPQHLPTDTRAEGSHNLSLGKFTRNRGGFLFVWPLYPNPIFSELQFSIEFCQCMSASFPTSLPTPPHPCAC